ncbi:hypothetical protein KIV56_13365 [Cryobacterium breve]|uniref:Glycosyltransferase family 2 protein n=1 Tax=Cryobacterium breve TaxID=1259258 RepID=A0ABY7NCW8_9MICO|nr:hypothetical protein [Cryobacterium breve]WBM79379.1 hypothetical protein KIV56_13365 [Cryobacterium breve]
MTRTATSPDGSYRIVSLTTYPARIRSVHLTLRSILKQSLSADSIYLVLSSLEFPGGEPDLPKTLRRLVLASKGRITIQYTPDNKRSFKKLLPVLEVHPGATVITADDDVLYRRSWMKELDSAGKQFPGSVVGTRGTLIGCSGETALPYTEWRPAPVDRPSHQIFLTGRGGILYPPGSLDERVFEWETASSLCASADDIWFKAMASLAGAPAVKIDTGREYPSNGATQGTALWRSNVSRNENDAAFKAVVDHFNLWPMYSD